MNKKKSRILLIDNYDSFTYNLVQAFQVEGAEVLVFRNDKINSVTAKDIKPTHIVISPGPGNPGNAGVSVEIINHCCQSNSVVFPICVSKRVNVGTLIGIGMITASLRICI